MLTKNESGSRWLEGAGGWGFGRHTFASHLVMRGAPLKAAQELLGHASIEMTMRYAHLSPDARRVAVGLLDIPGSCSIPDALRDRHRVEEDSGQGGGALDRAPSSSAAGQVIRVQ
jgi:hypothetical protein